MDWVNDLLEQESPCMVHDLRQHIGIHSQCTKLPTVCLHPATPFITRLLHSMFEMDGAVI